MPIMYIFVPCVFGVLSVDFSHHDTHMDMYPWTCIILLVFSDKGGKLGEPVCILKTPWLLGNRKYQVEKGANSTTFQSEKIYLPKLILTCDSGIHTLVYINSNITNTFFQHRESQMYTWHE